MDYLVNYLSYNIPLFSISAVMLFIAFRNLRLRKKESLYFIVFTTIVLFLSVIVFLEKYSQAVDLVILGTISTSLGYILRPILLFIFILLANMDEKRPKWFYLACFIPLIPNFIIYLLPLFFNVPVVSTLVFYYQSLGNGTADFCRGTFLNFTSHAICGFYLVMLTYVSLVRFHGKHKLDGLVLIFCVVIIIATVVTEMLVDRNDLLNIVCEICAMVNYIFIMSINTSRDPLTNLYDRRTYYQDIGRYIEKVNGIAQIDMNELKYINDTFGHEEGDKALKTLSKVFLDCIDKRSMCLYRISGDEFVILMFDGNEEQLLKAETMIKENVSKTKYSIAIGSYFINKKENLTFDEAMKIAEVRMYKDKKAHYLNSGHDRRLV